MPNPVPFPLIMKVLLLALLTLFLSSGIQGEFHINVTKEEFENALLESTPLQFPENHIVFLGDSTMYRRMMWVMQYVPKGCLGNHIVFDRCNLNQQWGIPPPAQWRVPHLEGPYSAKEQGCTDCHGCPTTRIEKLLCNSSLEYIAMEFFRDVEIQSDLWSTSQENILHYYLVPKYKDLKGVTFIFASGIHDVQLGNATCDRFCVVEKNMKWLIKLWKDNLPNVHFVWLGHSTTQSDVRYSQTAEVMRRVDEIAIELCRQNHISTFNFFDTSTRFPDFLEDNIHHTRRYYVAQSKIVLKVIDSFRAFQGNS